MEPGTLISGRYRLIRQLGEGGMGEVWAARNERTDRDFAIKLLLPALARNREALERFVREAKATGRLRDPGIVDVFDAGQTADGRPYLVMELLSGESLEARLAREGRLDPFAACTSLARIARSLHRAHQAGIVHRDLSSANIFFAKSGDAIEVPKILDFGVSKIVGPEYDGRVRTGNGAVLGSPAYMSPEQAQGAEKVDCRADVWSLGVLLYECLCGQHPFIARNYNALMMQIIGRPHRSLADVMPGLEPELAALVDACLIKDRAARVQTALELAERLEAMALVLAASRGRRRSAARAVRNSIPPTELPPRMLPPGARLWHTARQRLSPRLVIALGSALGGTAVGLALGAMVLGSASDPAPRAEPGVAARQAPAATAATPSTAPLVTPVSGEPTAEGPAEPETDLVRATAKSLGIRLHRRRARLEARPPTPAEQPPEGPPEPRAQSVASLGLPRKNPY